jgi:hypothetical protein
MKAIFTAIPSGKIARALLIMSQSKPVMACVSALVALVVMLVVWSAQELLLMLSTSFGAITKQLVVVFRTIVNEEFVISADRSCDLKNDHVFLNE